MPLSLTQLRLVHFRSYVDAALELAPRPVVLAGANGTGKTNCLEAISLLSPGRGLRGARLNNLQRKAPREAHEFDGEDASPFAANLWAVAGIISRTDGTWDIGTGLTPTNPGAPAKRVMHLNGAAAQSADIAELMPMLWLTPVQDRLFVDGAADRRRFLDRLVFGLDSGHARRASRYERAMRERLRLFRDGNADAVWLDGLEETMAIEGVAVTEARLKMISELNAELSTRGSQGTFPCAHLVLETGLGDADNEVAHLRARFAALRSRDAEAARTNFGPHLADLHVRHTTKRADARDCSTGEQKALLVSIVLANAWLLKRRSGGTAPILLLDEIAAHLDATRRAGLFEEILSLSAQAWMTGTDASLFAPLAGHALLLAIEDGHFVEGSWQ